MSAIDFGLILRDRPYHDCILDLDKSKGVPPASLMNEYRFIRLFGVLMEQVWCDTLDGTASFRAVDKA